MSEENKPYKFVVIKPSALVKIEIGATYYTQLQNLLGYLFEQAESEQVALEKLVELEKRKPETPWEQNLVVVMSLILEIEEKAKEQGLTGIHEASPQPPEPTAPQAPKN